MEQAFGIQLNRSFTQLNRPLDPNLTGPWNPTEQALKIQQNKRLEHNWIGPSNSTGHDLWSQLNEPF